MKKLLLTSTLVLFLSSAAYADDVRPVRGVTPYGDFCWKCSNYGMKHSVRSRLVSYHDAVSAVKAYFHRRGYAIGRVHGSGRFIKVDVLKGKKIVDCIIFDRRSGRIRSIY
jgi:hypothetical protein